MSRDDWEISGYDRDVAVKLVHDGVNPLLAVLLASRGLSGREDVRFLTEESCLPLYDPMQMRDMDRAVARLRRAIEDREHVAVHGDYDVDGLTSVCLLTNYLRGKGLTCETYIPERLEGYGVKAQSLELLREKGVTLVITVDCGITAAEEAEYAKTLGLDMIITDHHECKERLPDAAAVIDPKRPDCSYPNCALAGVGVAFKLVCAMEGADRTDALLSEYGDLVALGTIADVMPVVGENRLLIRRGVEEIRRGGRAGIRHLAVASGCESSRDVSMNCVGFSLAPRLNAAGRLGNISAALELLMAQDDETAERLAQELCEMNRTRQQMVNDVYGDAVRMLEADPPEGRPIVIASDKWHQGVAGIVASRLAEAYLLPAVVICVENGSGRGSCRSVGDFNLFAVLSKCADLLDHFGGHEMAAGLTVREDLIPELRRRLGEAYSAAAAKISKPALHVDFEVVKPGLLTVENVESLSLLEPFGNGNPSPLLCMQNVGVTGVIPLSGGRHTKLTVRKNGESFDCIFFCRTAKEIGVREGDTADLAFTPQINEFRGRRSVQFLLADVSPDRP